MKKGFYVGGTFGVPALGAQESGSMRIATGISIPSSTTARLAAPPRWATRRTWKDC